MAKEQEKEITRFAIVTTQRSGSNFLRSCLSSHSKIKCFDEVFLHDAEFKESYRAMKGCDPRLGVDINQYLEKLISLNSGYGAVGIDIKYDSLNHQILKALYDLDFSIIHLIRRDVLKTIISRVIGKNQEAPIRISPEAIDYNWGYINEMIMIHSGMIKSFNHLTIFYEDLTNGGEDVDEIPKEEADKILEFLNVDTGVPLKTKMKKKNPFKLEKLLSNYKEIKDYFIL